MFLSKFDEDSLQKFIVYQKYW